MHFLAGNDNSFGRMLQLLELPYGISLLATGDLSFAAAKCFDLEVWSAGQEKWLEVSSISSFRDFQSRRNIIRYRPAGRGKLQFVHNLNGFGLAQPKIMAPLIENGQAKLGTFRLPKVLSEKPAGKFLLILIII